MSVQLEYTINNITMPELTILDVTTLLSSAGVLIIMVSDNKIECEYNGNKFTIFLENQHYTTRKIIGRKSPIYDPKREGYQKDNHSCGYHALNYVLFGDKIPTLYIYERLERTFKTEVKNFYECGNFYTCCNRFKLQGCICGKNTLTEINYNFEGKACIYTTDEFNNLIEEIVTIPPNYISITPVNNQINIFGELIEHFEEDN